MGCYYIEVSFNLLKHNVSQSKEYIENAASQYDCSNVYSITEMEYNNNVYRNHMVTSVEFNTCNLNNMISFLKQIRKNKKYHIESIFNECTHELVYTSLYYRMIMDKFKSREKRTRSYSEDDLSILKVFEKSFTEEGKKKLF